MSPLDPMEVMDKRERDYNEARAYCSCDTSAKCATRCLDPHCCSDCYCRSVAYWDEAQAWADEAARKGDPELEYLPERGANVHVDNPGCWCRPTKTYTDPVNGTEVWVHRYADD